MSGFYKMDPSAWNQGTDDLPLEQEAAYLRIVNSMHIHHGPVRDNDRVLAGLFRCSPRKARALVDALVQAGKLTIEDGYITNERARRDLLHRGFVSISRSDSGAKGGRKRAENAAKALKEQEAAQANAQAGASSREEKRRDTVETNVSTGGEPPEERIPTTKELVWKHGRALLAAAGKSRDQAGRIVGKWVGDHGEVAVLEALDRCKREAAIDPVAFIEGALRWKAKAQTRSAVPQMDEERVTPDGRVFRYGGNIDGWLEIHR